ncbi:MAG: hypothetical protein PHF44_03565 [Candidatus Pacebacteria bacterium]|nr:hypothetical protein [Candidatus Paceibacterota bacterium]
MLNSISEQFNLFFNSPIFAYIIIGLKIIFITASAAMLGFIIYALITTLYLKRLFLWDWQEFFTFKPYGARHLARQWQKIMARLDTGLESEYKLAIIEGDSVLDDVLKIMGFAGETLGERLEKVTPAILSNLDAVSQAHATRNNIVHDPNYKLSLEEAQKTLGIYETALTNLQAL